MHATPSSAPSSRPGLTPAVDRARSSSAGLRRVFCGAVLLTAVATDAAAYTVSLTAAAPLTVYLQVGVGSFTNDYIYGGQPGTNTTINTVSVTVPASAVGNGTAQAMTTNSTAAQSYWDGYTYCSVPGQLYIGGFYRTTGGATAAAQVTATVPAALTATTGDTIPFSKIKWTSSGNGDSGAEPFPAATFVSGGVQNVGSMSSNTWNESCWTFSYVNNTVPPAGTFTGVVLYTLSAP
ncbi:MAG: hypothetical protein ACHQDD_01270 [Steroidobacterales bacterium]